VIHAGHASAEGNGARLALDEDSVYFTDPSAGVVRRVPKIGGQPATIATMQSRPLGIAVDAWCVYWANGGSGTSDGSVMKAPK
jgi:sugar lactone lactonase YvrE